MLIGCRMPSSEVRTAVARAAAVGSGASARGGSVHSASPKGTGRSITWPGARSPLRFAGRRLSNRGYSAGAMHAGTGNTREEKNSENETHAPAIAKQGQRQNRVAVSLAVRMPMSRVMAGLKTVSPWATRCLIRPRGAASPAQSEDCREARLLAFDLLPACPSPVERDRGCGVMLSSAAVGVKVLGPCVPGCPPGPNLVLGLSRRRRYRWGLFSRLDS